MATYANKWKFMCCLRDMVLDHDGIVFGGFVRDAIIHDHFAAKFYEKNNGATGNERLYCIPSYLPETAGRLVIPRDIDCRMTHTNLDAMLARMKRKRIDHHIVFVRDPMEYLSNADEPSDRTVSHVRLLLEVDTGRVEAALEDLPFRFSLPKIRSPVVKMDVIVSRDKFVEPFVSMPDFDCNALYLTKHGISLSSFVCPHGDMLRTERRRQEVIANIIEKKATYLNPDPDSEIMNAVLVYRVKKMLDGGWVLHDDVLRSVLDDGYEGYCIICHGTLERVHFKIRCCDGRYHGKCLQAAMTQGECAMRLTNKCILCKCVVPTTESNLPYLFSKYDI